MRVLGVAKTPVTAPGDSLATNPSVLLVLLTLSTVWNAPVVVGKFPEVMPATNAFAGVA